MTCFAKEIVEPFNIPDVKANGKGDSEVFQMDYNGHGAGLEIPWFIEHAEIGQDALSVDLAYAATLQNSGRIVSFALMTFGEAYYHCCLGAIGSEFFDG